MPNITISGDNADNLLVGTSGSDVIRGMGGNDCLYGEGGNDTLTGGKGGDYFVLGPGDGQDVVTDFTPSGNTGADHVVFQGFGNLGVGFVAPDRLYDGETFHTTLSHTLTVAGDHKGGTVLSWDTGESFHLQGVSPSDIPFGSLTVVDTFQYWIV